MVDGLHLQLQRAFGEPLAKGQRLGDCHGPGRIVTVEQFDAAATLQRHHLQIAQAGAAISYNFV